jgi:hypothetical protein
VRGGAGALEEDGSRQTLWGGKLIKEGVKYGDREEESARPSCRRNMNLNNIDIIDIVEGINNNRLFAWR